MTIEELIITLGRFPKDYKIFTGQSPINSINYVRGLSITGVENGTVSIEFNKSSALVGQENYECVSARPDYDFLNRNNVRLVKRCTSFWKKLLRCILRKLHV